MVSTNKCVNINIMKFNFERQPNTPPSDESKDSADTRRGRDFTELQKKMLKETEEGVNKLIEEDLSKKENGAKE